MSLISKLKAWWTGVPEGTEVIKPTKSVMVVKSRRAGFRELGPKKRKHTVEFALTYDGNPIRVIEIDVMSYSNDHAAKLATENLDVKIIKAHLKNGK